MTIYGRTLLASLLGCFALVSCSEQTGSSVSLPPSEAVDVAPSKLTILSWEDSIPPEILHKFSEESGIGIEILFYKNTDELIGFLKSQPSQFDVILTDEDTAARLKERRLLANFDSQQLPNLINLDPGNLALLPDSKASYAVPYLMDKTVLVYDPNRIEPPSTNWSLLWDQKVIGTQRVFMIDEPLEVFAVAHLSLGQSVNTAKPIEIASANNLLLDQLNSIDVSYASDSEILSALIEGKCVAAMLYHSSAIMVLEQREDMEVILPSEGAALSCDVLTISAESEHPEAAHSFLNFMIGADVAATCAEWNWCPSPNREAIKQIDPELMNDRIAYPQASILKKCEFHDSGNPERIRLVAKYFRALKDEIAQSEPFAQLDRQRQ
ncbi:MAG: spermidine/putrescine ABC transporter substrate-binding protein [Verrucomicrobiota bacterium]